MLSNFWRYSHFLLAVFSSVFLLIASLTGILLSTEPVVNELQAPNDKAATDTTTLAELIPKLKEEYIEVFTLSVNQQKAVIVDVIGFDEATDGNFYIHPNTGKKIADIPPKNEFYAWITTLHRSLFMHNSGRIIMGIAVFLLFLTTLSGIALVIKRTQGIRHIFTKINRQNKALYYHTILGRLTFIPILIMALGGTVLFLNTQGFLNTDQEEEKTVENNYAIHLGTQQEQSGLDLKDIYLTEIKALYFPFSTDESDYYELELADKTFKIHQYTHKVVSISEVKTAQKWVNLSETLHTGRGQWIWAVVLGLISLNLLYFMYSGTKIAWKRRASKTRNKINVDKAEFVLLVGSENGATRRFAKVLHQALDKSGKKVYTADMNQYQFYKNAQHLLILTSTYGDGEAPFNARLFLQKVKENPPINTLKTHIIGFGSMSYPKFCQYAIDVHEELQKINGFAVQDFPDLIDSQSYTSFKLALENWQKNLGINLSLPHEIETSARKQTTFTIVDKAVVDDGYALTFTLELKPHKNTTFQAGDLLAIAPPQDELIRYYSIGKTSNNNILLSIKKHNYGRCSNYLYQCNIGDEITGIIKINKSFHLPKKGNVLLIANGTGIAPFLGMHSMYSKQKKTFYLGGRNTQSFKLYHQLIQQNETTDIFNTIYFALSKEEGEAKYVQDLVAKQHQEINNLLQNKGTIMICGSLKMRDGVLKELKDIFKEKNGQSLQRWIEKGRIKMDCY